MKIVFIRKVDGHDLNHQPVEVSDGYARHYIAGRMAVAALSTIDPVISAPAVAPVAEEVTPPTPITVEGKEAAPLTESIPERQPLKVETVITHDGLKTPKRRSKK